MINRDNLNARWVTILHISNAIEFLGHFKPSREKECVKIPNFKGGLREKNRMFQNP